MNATAELKSGPHMRATNQNNSTRIKTAARHRAGAQEITTVGANLRHNFVVVLFFIGLALSVATAFMSMSSDQAFAGYGPHKSTPMPTPTRVIPPDPHDTILPLMTPGLYKQEQNCRKVGAGCLWN